MRESIDVSSKKARPLSKERVGHNNRSAKLVKQNRNREVLRTLSTTPSSTPTATSDTSRSPLKRDDEVNDCKMEKVEMVIDVNTYEKAKQPEVVLVVVNVRDRAQEMPTAQFTKTMRTGKVVRKIDAQNVRSK